MYNIVFYFKKLPPCYLYLAFPTSDMLHNFRSPLSAHAGDDGGDPFEVYNSSAYIVNEAEFEGMEAYGRKYLMASGIFAKKYIIHLLKLVKSKRYLF